MPQKLKRIDSKLKDPIYTYVHTVLSMRVNAVNLSEELGGLSVPLPRVVDPGHVTQTPRRRAVTRREGSETAQRGREVVAVETLVRSPDLLEEIHQ